MDLTLEQQAFIEEMDIDLARFGALDRDIEILLEIAKDYETHRADLLDEASYVANKLQRCEGVHTVRSRVKLTSHVIEKIIRKWESVPVSEKYDSITKENYKSVISDLIGVRAIYLFKKNWEVVHKHILSKWEQQEKVVIYYRNGDDLRKYDSYENCITEEHNKGYRSIHYIIPATKIDGQQVNCEIQTRTIFEEGWSEIDHIVRYPSFSDNVYLQEFLDIFNRISGSADEMGSFVHSLRELIKFNNILEQRRRSAAEAHESEVRALEEKIDQLFKDKADLQEIEAAYNSLKSAQTKNNESGLALNKEDIPKETLKNVENLNKNILSELDSWVKIIAAAQAVKNKPKVISFEVKNSNTPLNNTFNFLYLYLKLKIDQKTHHLVSFLLSGIYE